MNHKKEAEDWLIKDDFQQELLNLSEEESIEKEVRSAKNFVVFFKGVRIRSLSVSEKKGLRKRIEFAMIERQKKIQRIRWIAIAVFVFGLLGTFWIYKERSYSSLEQYVQHLEIPRDVDKTLLILGKEKEISIAQENSEISYEPKENDIQINQNRKIKNEGDTLLPVFHTLVVPYGKRSHLVLSDGTKVWLNSGSRLVYPAIFCSGNREVYLQGEAIFKVVKKDHSHFVVNTDDFSVKVLGTIFNITAYPEDHNSSAVLERGKIELVGKKNLFPTKMNITPGTRVVFDPEEQSFSSSQVTATDYLSWKDGFLILHREPLPSILNRLSRYYNVEFVLKNHFLEEETFTGSLDLKTTPQDVLSVIAKMVPFDVRIESNKIYITVCK